MAWTAPATWTTGQIITAANLNEQIRDNMLQTAPAKVTTAWDVVVGTGANTLQRMPLGAVPYGGTTTNVGNAYVLAAPTISALVTGLAVSFMINADSTGAATLNWSGQGAVAIKKANGNDATNLKQNVIYTVRYNGTNFILQGEGGYGDATAADILDGKMAVVDGDEVTGTMPNRAGDTATLSSSVAGTTLKLLASDGYRDGVDDNVTITDADFVATNIREGTDLFGTTGSLPPGDFVAGATANRSGNTERFNSATGAWETKKSFQVSGEDGSVRLTFQFYGSSSLTDNKYRITVAGVEVVGPNIDNGNAWNSKSHDVSFTTGQMINVDVWADSGISAAGVRNFVAGFDRTIPYTTIWD